MRSIDGDMFLFCLSFQLKHAAVLVSAVVGAASMCLACVRVPSGPRVGTGSELQLVFELVLYAGARDAHAAGHQRYAYTLH